MSDIRPLRIAQVAPPLERVPPTAYGGTERIIHELTRQLVRRGHEVTVFGSGDSDVPGRLIPTIAEPLRPSGFDGDIAPFFVDTMDLVAKHADEFDLIHSHLEWWSIHLARMVRKPLVATFHGRLDLDYSRRLFSGDADQVAGLVAISRSQASVHPDLDWTIIHNGLSLHEIPAGRGGDGFCFVGRVERIKGILEAIEIAQLTERPLTIAAKVGPHANHQAFFNDVFLPAVEAAGSLVEYVGEIGPRERDRLFAESYATLMPGAWPEPFGLVAIESLAAGTPILARRVGGLPEIIREGVDGYFGDDAQHLAFLSDEIERLDRTAIRERVIERFSAARMADRYEELYLRRLDSSATPPDERPELDDLPDLDGGSVTIPPRPRPAASVPQLLRPVGPGGAIGNGEDDDRPTAVAVGPRTRQAS